MKKRLFSIIPVLSLFCNYSFAQQPPALDSFNFSEGYDNVNLYIKFSPNDTGTIFIQVQLDQGTGNIVYDSIYSVPAADSNTTTLYLGPLWPCQGYTALVDLANQLPNNLGQGQVYNPLFNCSTTCTSGIPTVSVSDFSLLVIGRSLELHSSVIPEDGNVEIYDLTGRKIVSAGLNQLVQQIPFNAGGGMYLLRVTGQNQALYTTKFVID